MVVFLLVVTAVFWGAAPIFDKMGVSRVDPLVGVTIRSIVATTGLVALVFFLGRGKLVNEVTLRDVFVFGASGILAGLLGMWTYYAALRLEATSMIVPIAASYPLVTAVLSAVILREGLTFSRVIGTALIIFGIWLVK
jgi:transporter family protein